MPWDPAVWPKWDEERLARVTAFARTRTTTPALHFGRYLEVVGAVGAWVFERMHGADRLLVALNNGEVAADLQAVLAGASWADLALLDDAEEVVSRGAPEGEAAEAAAGEAGAAGAADALRVPAVDAMILQLPTE